VLFDFGMIADIRKTMAIIDSLPDGLVRAARNVEERFDFLGVPTRKVPLEDWNVLTNDVRAVIPEWIPNLLASFKLLGGGLEYQRKVRPASLELFGFHEPKN
jgi:hypothetical protein